MKRCHDACRLLIFCLIFIQSGYTQQDQYGTLTHDGKTREYWIHIPPGLQPGSALPLVINLHGLQSDASQQMAYTHFNAIADTAHFFVVYPQGLYASSSGGTGTQWNAYLGNSTDDVGFIDQLIDQLNREFDIDLSRIYATGMSNGGFMVYRLACELSHRIAAIASVTGSMNFTALASCNPGRAVPVLHIHGTSDQIVPFNGSPFFTPPVKEIIQWWVDQNDCAPEPVIIPVPNTDLLDFSSVTRYSFRNCGEESEVQFYLVSGGGHTWPGAAPNIWLGATNQDINASQEIWTFFRRHVHPNPAPGTVRSENQVSRHSIIPFPNPCSQSLYLKNLPKDVQRVRLWDSGGRLWLDRSIQQYEKEIKLSTSGLPPGLFWVQLETKKNNFIFMSVQKI